MDNIRYGSLDATDEEVITAASKDLHILLLSICQINMKQKLLQKDRI